METQSSKTRADVWAWAVRLYKTRSLAATAIKAGHFKVNGQRIKPATEIKIGDEVRAFINDHERILVVTKLIKKRVGAPVALTCYEDHSGPKPARKGPGAPIAMRDPGSGRPTKKERRALDYLRGRSEK